MFSLASSELVVLFLPITSNYFPLGIGVAIELSIWLDNGHVHNVIKVSITDINMTHQMRTKYKLD